MGLARNRIPEPDRSPPPGVRQQYPFVGIGESREVLAQAVAVGDRIAHLFSGLGVPDA